MSVGGKRNCCGLGNIPDIDCGDAHLAEGHRVGPSLRKRVFQRCVVLAKIDWANNRELDIELPQRVFNSELRGKVWNILEVLHAKDRVIDDMFQLQLLACLNIKNLVRAFIAPTLNSKLRALA